MLGAENRPQILKFAENIIEIRLVEGTTTKPIQHLRQHHVMMLDQATVSLLSPFFQKDKL